ncbi:MAG: GTPase ObgE [Deltaproteobacteria bacterium]|uniref:GTPase Obg n=1 Tax=Candidatus Zymogenus saltonus TaxID=2844893 RepID=A0A9D8K913_9DELT|nr:GTPase ObgE [Candidatus Zymogenus saltonus]
MKFVDEATIEIKSGAGGDGCMSFRREKYVPKGGPNGGDGGNGGDVYIVGNPQMSTLLDYKYRQHWAAKRGAHGKGKDQHGKNGKDLIIPVPMGTEVLDAQKGELIVDVVEPDVKVLLLKGGRGGRGNARFASPTNRAPREFEKGGPERSAVIRLSLKVIADVGIIGFPNAGKSTLISKISRARPKIADYPFTTLTPTLGIVSLDGGRSFVMADIPGIIEGAHKGVGLGTRFLKHVERTKVLIHLLDLNPQSGRDPARDYEILNSELKSFSTALYQKPQVVAANKTDLPGSKEKFDELVDRLSTLDIDIFPISAINGDGTKRLLNAVYGVMEGLGKKEAE